MAKHPIVGEYIPRKVQLALRSATMVEHPDPTPVAIPEDRLGGPSLEQRLQAFVRGELSRAAEETGMETEQEANDFDLPDDDEDESLWSPYQVAVMVEEFALEDQDERERPDALGATETDDRPEPEANPSLGEKTSSEGTEGRSGSNSA